AEHIADRCGRLRLKGLVLELELHEVTSLCPVRWGHIRARRGKFLRNGTRRTVCTQSTWTRVPGDRLLKISVTLILAASEAKALSRKTAHWGREAAMSR
ncbi:DUF2007 domain-containing protein, partial [Dysosmobacter welbionis]